ncbi:MAG TPA: hypothetical protein VGL53_30630 [Bryobacteraceae bacterium]|jgi:hypothetical protein
MKHQVLSSLIAFGFAALASTAPAMAQARQTATIPFAFVANGVQCPQGEYEVQRIPDHPSVIQLTNRENGHSTLVPTPILSGAANTSGAKLVFTAQGDGVRLSEVWFDGYPGMLTSSNRKDLLAKVVIKAK